MLPAGTLAKHASWYYLFRMPTIPLPTLMAILGARQHTKLQKINHRCVVRQPMDCGIAADYVVVGFGAH